MGVLSQFGSQKTATRFSLADFAPERKNFLTHVGPTDRLGARGRPPVRVTKDCEVLFAGRRSLQGVVQLQTSPPDVS